ncbi:MAG: GMC family oxidoreductase N-terminal domain-containing protein [Alteraurantiacibacter sp.]
MKRETDIIVVGAGSAGCAVARRLADKGLDVLLIEAGKTDNVLKSRVPALVGSAVNDPDFDWCYSAEEDPSVGGRRDVWPAGKRLGGGSAINGMMFIRGHRYDYDRWASLGAKGWDYQSVLPYFRRMEDNERGGDAWRGTGGPISVSEIRSRYPVTEAWMQAVEQAGFPRSSDLNGETAEGVDYIQLSQRSGLRCSSARGYLADKPANLQILLERTVDRILIEGGTARGIVLRGSEGAEHIHARKGVVLSAGALNTPRLLMLSGIGPAAHLQEHGIDVVQDLPGVGGNLQEHVGTHLVNEVNARTLNQDARGLAGVGHLAAFLLRRKGALTTGIGHAQAFLHTRAGLPAPNVQLAFSAFAFDVTPSGNLALRKNASVATFIALMRPSSRGRVMLNGPDPELPPRIEHRLFGNDDDLDQLVEGVQVARRVMQQEAISPAVTSEVRPGTEPDDLESLRMHVTMASLPMYHPVGTARIGEDEDPSSVLDADLAVRGIGGLWVADASIMPTIPAGNTNATAIMIGDKAADHIIRS